MFDPFSIELHDSHILNVELDRRFQKLCVVVHAPYNSPDCFIEFVFEAILRMEFETPISITGEQDHPLMISGLTRHSSDVEQRFSDNLRKIEIASAEAARDSKRLGFTEVCHVTIDAENTHRGFGLKEGVNGIHLVCRRVVARSAEKRWWSKAVPTQWIPGDPLDDVSKN